MNYFDYWIPIYKKMYFKYKLQNDSEALIELEASIWKNWKLSKEEKRLILKKVRGGEIKL